MKFKAPPNRKKVEGPESMPPQIQSSNVDLRIKQAMNHAVAEANQDACTGNFKAFQSPFGNYLVPVIPTRAKLDG